MTASSFLAGSSTSSSASIVASFSKSLVSPFDFFTFLPLDAAITSSKALNYSEETDDAELVDQASAMRSQIQVLQLMNHDLEKLLSLGFVQFWSQVLYDNSLFRFLDSYLWCAKKHHQEHTDEKEMKGDSPSNQRQRAYQEFKQLHHQIRRRVFMTFVRMTSLRESTFTITLEEFGKLAYDNWLFSVPGLMDFAVLYSKCQLAPNVVTTVLTSHSGYQESLSQTLQTVQKTLEDLQTAVQKNNAKTDNQKRANLLVDALINLEALQKVYPPASKVYKKLDLVETLVVAYEISIPLLLNSGDNLSALQPVLAQAGRICVRVISRIVDECFLKYLGEEKRPEEKKGDMELLAQDFTGFIMSFSDIAIAIGQRVDPSVSSCLQLGSCFTAYCRKGQLAKAIQGFPLSVQQELGDSFDYLLDLIRARGAPARKATKSLGPSMKDDPPNVDALIGSLTSIFSDITSEFALECLRHYNFQTEVAINNILSGSLPSFLADKQFSEAALDLNFLDSGLGQPPIRRTTSTSSGILDDDSTEDVSFQAYLARTGRKIKDKDVGALGGMSSSLWSPPVSSKEQIRNTLRGVEYEDEYDDQYEDFTNFAALDAKNPDHRRIVEDLDIQENTRNYNIGPLLRNSNRQYQDEGEVKTAQPAESVSWPPPRQKTQSQNNNTQKQSQQGNNTQNLSGPPVKGGRGAGAKGGKNEEKSGGKGQGRGAPVGPMNDSDGEDGPRRGNKSQTRPSAPNADQGQGGRKLPAVGKPSGGGRGRRYSDDDDDGPRGQQLAPRHSHNNNARSDSDDEQQSRKRPVGRGEENGGVKSFGRGAAKSVGRGGDVRSGNTNSVDRGEVRTGTREGVRSVTGNGLGATASDSGRPVGSSQPNRGATRGGRGGGPSRSEGKGAVAAGRENKQDDSSDGELEKNNNGGTAAPDPDRQQKYKDRNKARLGNHNRKAGAAKKMAGRGGFGGSFGGSATTD